MKINSVLIAGAGAIGLSTAESIFNYDPACISILAGGERLERYKKDGLAINGRKLDFNFAFGQKADLILVACKFHHLDQIIEDLRPSIGKDTVILSLLNGITSEEIISRKLKIEPLTLAMVLGTDALHEAGGTSFNKKGTIHFGEAEGKNGEREERIAEFFTRSGVPFVLESNMKRKLWYKYMMNVGFNQVTAVLRLPYKSVQKNGKSCEINEAHILIEKAMREVIAVANAEGINLNEDDMDNAFNVTNTLNPEGTTSMCQDVIAERKTEVEMFSLSLMEMAKKHALSVPVNETLYLQLKTIEERYGKA